MLVAIVADIHDNLANLEKCLAWLKQAGAEKLLCLGDLANEETLDFLAANFGGEIFLVSGNADTYDPDTTLSFGGRIKHLGESGSLEIGDCRLAMVHEKWKLEKMKNLAEYDFAFYGHSHRPWLEKNGRLIIANPGNLAGAFYNASFALLETKEKQLSLKSLREIQKTALV